MQLGSLHWEMFLTILHQLIYKVTGSGGAIKQARFDYL